MLYGSDDHCVPSLPTLRGFRRSVRTLWMCILQVKTSTVSTNSFSKAR